MSATKYAAILAATKSESILAVIEGLPVDASGFFLSETQMDGIEASLVSAAAMQAANEQLVADAAALKAANETLTADNATLKAENEKLGKTDATKYSGTGADADPKNTNEKTGWAKFETSVDKQAEKYKAIKSV